MKTVFNAILALFLMVGAVAIFPASCMAFYVEKNKCK